MSAYFEEVLRKMGWVDGFEIPVANEENKLLEAKVAELTHRKARASVALQNTTVRYDALEKHLKMVTQENEQHQKLITAYRQQLQSEETKYSLLKSQREVTERDIKIIAKQMGDVCYRQQTKKNDLEKAAAKMEKIKSEMSWDAEALKAWEESLNKRDEESELLKKYTKEDDAKMNELEARRKITEGELRDREKCIAQMFTEITNYEQMLERSAKVFRQQENERETLIKHWKETVRNLKQRNEDIDNVNNEMIASNDLLKRRKQDLDEQNRFLGDQENANKEIEIENHEGNVVCSRIRKEIESLIQYVALLQSESDTLKRLVISTASQLEKARAENRNLDNELDLKQVRIERIKQERENMQKKCLELRNANASTMDRAKVVEDMLEEEQRKEKILLQDLEKMQGILFRAQQTFMDQKEITKLKEIEINKVETSIGLMRKQARSYYLEIQGLNEMLYELDFRKNQMERKISEFEGQAPDGQHFEFTEKIKSLEKQHAELSETKQLITSQINKLQDEMRKLANEIALDDEVFATLKDKLQDQVLMFETGGKHMAAAKQRTQEKQVEENILLLKVNQIKKAKKKEEKNIYNLQKFRLELETAMKERQIEINTNKEILMVKRRNFDEERGRLKRDIMSRYTKIEQLQKKYGIAMMMLGKGEGGQTMSVTYYKIKNAQEKYMLQQEGDELDQKIRRAETEIVAMENTLKVVNSTNSTYKHSLEAVEENDEEVQELKELDIIVHEKGSELRKLKKKLENKYENINEKEEQLKSHIEERERLANEYERSEKEMIETNRIDADKQEKLHRVDRHLRSMSKYLEQTDVDKYDKDLWIKHLKESNKYALHQLTDLSLSYPDMSPLIRRYTSHYKIPLPEPRRSFTPSSSSGSVVSFVSKSSNESRGTAAVAVTNIVFDFEADTQRDKKKPKEVRVMV